MDAINSIAVDLAKTLCACATDNYAITLLDPSSHKVVPVPLLPLFLQWHDYTIGLEVGRAP